MKVGEHLYTYKAKCTKVIDGDTLDIVIDFGFNTYGKRRVRLLGVDTQREVKQIIRKQHSLLEVV